MSITAAPFIKSVVDSVTNAILSYDNFSKVGKIKLKAPYEDDPDMQAKDRQRFNDIVIDCGNIYRLSNGDFLTYLKCEGEYYVCLSVDSFESHELDVVDQLMEEMMAFRDDIEPCFFMHMVHYMKGYYRISNGIGVYEIVEKLGLEDRELEKGYIGHDINEIMDLFIPLRLYKVESESILLMADRWYLICALLFKCQSLQSRLIDDELKQLAYSAFEKGKCSLENIYLSLTSSHHKYMFVEIYRCLEALYYLPWMLLLKNSSGIKHDAFSLAKMVSKSIEWKEKEQNSINKLFNLLSDDTFNYLNLNPLSFYDFDIAQGGVVSSASKMKVSEIIYKIRNQSVHQQDYEDIKPYKITAADWMVLTKFIYRCTHELYSNYKKDIDVYKGEFVDVL